MADQAPEAGTLGVRASEKVFNWSLAGSWAPSTRQQGRGTHNRRSFHRAEGQTTDETQEGAYRAGVEWWRLPSPSPCSIPNPAKKLQVNEIAKQVKELAEPA